MKAPSFHPAVNRVLANFGWTPKHVAAIAPSTILPQTLAAFLRAHDSFVWDGCQLGRSVGRTTLSLLPAKPRSRLYQRGVRLDAAPERSLQSFRSETVARWTVRLYPRRPYPVVLIGPSNGAAIHLAAALKAPLLPQDFALSVRRCGLHPDEPARSLEAGRTAARKLLAAAPNTHIHQVHDPVQRRLACAEALHFRCKRLTLGPAYEQFLMQQLEPGGTLVVVDCGFAWPSIQLGERHFFQHGTFGGLSPADYYGDGPEVRAFLRAQNTSLDRWELPAPDGERTEAEWGYAPELTRDVLRFADRHGYRVDRLHFQHPEHLSPWIADLYREHVVRSSGAPDRLIIESDLMTDPWCVHRTGSVPFWTASTGVASASAVDAYLDSVEAFEELRATLPSNGVEAPSIPPIERWREILRRARGAYGFLGVREEDYPADFAVYLRYHDALKRLPDAPGPVRSLSWPDVRAYAADLGREYPVRLEWIGE